MGIYHRAAGDHKHVCLFFHKIKKHKKDMVANRHAYNPQQPMGLTCLMSRNITMFSLIIFFAATAKTLHMQLLFSS